MAAEAFTGIYCTALKDLCKSLEPQDLVVLLFLAAHADGAGRCRPGVKYIAQSLNLRFEEVRYRLDHLERQGLFRYLRRNARDEITGEFLPDVYAINPRILLTKNPVTHPAENAELAPVTHPAENAEPDQFRIAPVQLSQPDPEPETSNQNQLTNTINQHQQPDGNSNYAETPVTGADPNSQKGEKAKTNSNHQNPVTPVTPNPAPAGSKSAPAGHAESNTPPSSAPPPSSDWRPVQRYINALEDARLEALANELRAIAPTRLYNARELVMHYGEADVRKGLAQLAAAKEKGNVYNPCGLLTTWLRNGAVKAEPVESTKADEWHEAMNRSKYREFIQS